MISRPEWRAWSSSPPALTNSAEVIRKCERDRMALAPLGACRTLRYLRSAPVEVGISLSAMAQVISYEPDDMTVVAGAGITLGALDAALGAHGQHLPVDPPAPDRTRIGALLAAAQSGPLRLSAGTVRDFLIGVQFAGHGGHAVRGGGRVVKNVAGYDLMKVMIGSFGTLGIITEATFKGAAAAGSARGRAGLLRQPRGCLRGRVSIARRSAAALSRTDRARARARR